ncbi:MBL fold metallo-hydrolase [Benzoatithermus flavus]|uniref:MBL fold metallo-hydrolase n=1 Tax=Benzoatithermus flavus TaxID=3108223 RepID=A0ABU8XU65_9PROT
MTAGMRSRREILGAIGAGVGLALTGLPVAGVRPAAAAGPAQVPGFYRFKVGPLTVTTLSDGNLILMPPSIYAVDAPPAELTALLEANLLPTDRVVGQANVTLIDTGEQRILFDVGSGPNFQPTAGRLATNLAAAGIDPASISTIVLTHAHPDHVWGILDGEGKVRFPNAGYVIAEPEWTFWMKEGFADTAPDPMKPFVRGAQRQLGAVAERVKRIRPGDPITPSITTIPAPGHTPGHMAVHVATEGQSLLLSADCFNHPVISLANPSWHFGFDTDPEQAVATRKRILDMAATDRLWVVGYHMPWPGLGQVARAGNGYRWIPANFTWSL